MKIPTRSKFNEIRNELNLTDRQLQIFDLKFQRGWRYIDIAAEIGVSQETICDEMKVIHNKLKFINEDNYKEFIKKEGG